MKTNAKHIKKAEGLRAMFRSTGIDNPSHSNIDLKGHERRLRCIEACGVMASYRI
ncbi:hypothetical protein BRPE64_BCDS05300 [Caballeronia insecticola]|uniref:Uncharacterized protein n=1 Tax=Caballeronia insecticola TaxID=758793 RepID=R4X000_9BURK|nr:hypothetical protein BRPE64_BCDS05300 [Caballeronia insecticola]